MAASKFGSLWHRWDLHIHTDASDGKGTCQEILDEAKNKKVRCIAVTDHHTVDNVDIMKALAEPMEITVISGVEFRTEYGKASVHMIGLFPDEFNGIKLNTEFLKENILNPLGISRTSIIQKGREYLKGKNLTDEEYFKHGMFLVQVDFKNAADLIHQYGGLVTVHAGGKNNSIDEEMKHEGKGKRNVSIEDSLGPVKEELFKNGYIDICDITKPKDSAFYLKEFKIPSITTSDAHDVAEVGSNACWIKADLSFEGLKQIISEPERISFEYPELLDRIRKNPDKFIRGIDIRRAEHATMPEVWFDNIHINLNPGLVAIIGNKGCGKSALTDIISLCADSYNQNWAFLTEAKFRMPKPYDRSRQTEASIQWFDGSRSSNKTLDMHSDLTKPERVKYIPQNFLETLCTTENDADFESELKKIIFQYLKPEQRYGLTDLDSIISYLTKENADTCAGILARIKEQNAKIIQKEDMLKPEFRAKLENALRYKQEQLSNVQQAKPKEVLAPTLVDDTEAQKAKEELVNIQHSLQILSMELQKYQQEYQYLFKSIQDLKATKEKLDRICGQLAVMKAEVCPLLITNGLDANSILSIDYHPEVLDDKIKELEQRQVEVANQFNNEISDSAQSQYNMFTKQLDLAKKKLSEPELRYQSYLKAKAEWEKTLEEITGTPEIDGSIKNLQQRLDYIDHSLLDELNADKDVRQELVDSLLRKKSEVLAVYNSLFSPIVDFIKAYHKELKDYPIEFNSAFVIRNFSERFFDLISQQAAGSYYGKEQGASRIKACIDSVNVEDVSSFGKFANQINIDLLRDNRDGQDAARYVEKQLRKGHSKQEVYDFIYGMQYVEPLFQLKMNGKPLSSLSPGERGALLLLLYLFIDMDDKPLVIDQPEENLDNESVYKYLVHFVKAAKKKRQIIMVTHNPNLAVVCDADQIIQMKIDKLHENVVSYESGAIENPKMNKIIVDILEGTYPAFRNRDSKYFDKTF